MVKSMKAAILYNPGDIRYEEVNIPEVGPQEVLIKVKDAGICGSDIFRLMKAGTYSYPLIPGHEFSGEVVEIGKKVTNVKVDDRVVTIPLIPCRKCNPCSIGQYSLCENYNYLGSRSDGGFTEFAKLPQGRLFQITCVHLLKCNNYAGSR